MKSTADHQRGQNGGPMFLGHELCPICECCSLGSEHCDNCGGNGSVEVESIEGWEEGDIEACDWCSGAGSYVTCFGGCNVQTRERHKPDPARLTESESGTAIGSAPEGISSAVDDEGSP